MLSVTYVLLTLRPQLKFLVHRNSIGCCPDSFLLCARKSGPETMAYLPGLRERERERGREGGREVLAIVVELLLNSLCVLIVGIQSWKH